MLTQTLPYFGIKWIENSVLISKLLKGYFNLKPVKPRIVFTWDASIVLCYLVTLISSFKMIFKVTYFKTDSFNCSYYSS